MLELTEDRFNSLFEVEVSKKLNLWFTSAELSDLQHGFFKVVLKAPEADRIFDDETSEALMMAFEDHSKAVIKLVEEAAARYYDSMAQIDEIDDKFKLDIDFQLANGLAGLTVLDILIGSPDYEVCMAKCYLRLLAEAFL